RCGNSQSPDSTICFAASVKRGSSLGQGSRRPMPAPSSTNATSMNSQNARRSCAEGMGRGIIESAATRLRVWYQPLRAARPAPSAQLVGLDRARVELLDELDAAALAADPDGR